MYARRMAFADLEAHVGSELGVSRWIAVEQDMIDAFAALTDDAQPIHVDPQAAARSPFGGTIAHGFLTLSLLSSMAYEAVAVPREASESLNYGFDRIRFLTPVRAGQRIRGRFTLAGLERGEGRATMRLSVTVEIDGTERPALVAEWIVLLTMP